MSNEKKRILIMEDSDLFADMLMETLTSDNYIIERAVNGFEGIKKVFKFLPHIIITDVEMPIFKGYQAARFLKSRNNTKAIPVIMFTSLNETKDKFWGKHAGADIYMEKSPDNFTHLCDTIAKTLEEQKDIDFAAIEREGKKIDNDSIIEIVNGLLDNKLFQTTVIGMLAELSENTNSLDMIVNGIFNLMQTICESEIVSIMICGSKGSLHIYTANFANFTTEITDDFLAINVSDFNNYFPDFNVKTKNTINFMQQGNNSKKINSYIKLPLTNFGEKYASVHIANTINDYFSPGIVENIKVFLNAASPIIANALSMRELAELQKNTREAFARYVPADAIDEIIETSSKMVSQIETRNITILFSDIREFTSISEYSTAQGVVDFLNTYFAEMGSMIISESGHIDKFIGDAIMAVFGAFYNLENPTDNAVRAAVKMLAVNEKIDTSGVTLTKNGLKTGIGINTGICILGNIGFRNKMDYTVIGDTVNIASRIESLTKLYGHPLIVSEYVYEALKNRFIFRRIDNVRVMGKNKPVGIYAVYTDYMESEGLNPDLPVVPALLMNKETLANYNKGLQLFYMFEWNPAQEYFIKALEYDENDIFSKLYLQRAIEFMKNPPPDTWDGVVTLAKK